MTIIPLDQLAAAFIGSLTLFVPGIAFSDSELPQLNKTMPSIDSLEADTPTKTDRISIHAQRRKALERLEGEALLEKYAKLKQFLQEQIKREAAEPGPAEGPRSVEFRMRELKRALDRAQHENKRYKEFLEQLQLPRP